MITFEPCQKRSAGHQCLNVKVLKGLLSVSACFNLGGHLQQLATPGVGSDAGFIPSRGHCGDAIWNETLSRNVVFLSDCASGPSTGTAGVTYSRSDRSWWTSLASWTENDGHERARAHGRGHRRGRRDHGYGCGCWSSSECEDRGNETVGYGCGTFCGLCPCPCSRERNVLFRRTHSSDRPD